MKLLLASVTILVCVLVWYMYRSKGPDPDPKHVSTTVLNFDKSSYAYIDSSQSQLLAPLYQSFKYTIKFNLETRDTSGIIFIYGNLPIDINGNGSIGNDGSVKPYIAGVLSNGQLIVIIAGSMGIVKLPSVVNVTDGKSHIVIIERNGPAWLLKVDGNVAAIATSGTEKTDSLPSSSVFYLGGRPLTGRGIGAFRGCLSDLYINESPISKYLLIGNVQLKC